MEKCETWDSLLNCSPGCVDELKFWMQNINCFKGYSISRSVTINHVLKVDASGYGIEVWMLYKMGTLEVSEVKRGTLPYAGH